MDVLLDVKPVPPVARKLLALLCGVEMVNIFALLLLLLLLPASLLLALLPNVTSLLYVFNLSIFVIRFIDELPEFEVVLMIIFFVVAVTGDIKFFELVNEVNVVCPVLTELTVNGTRVNLFAVDCGSDSAMP